MMRSSRWVRQALSFRSSHHRSSRTGLRVYSRSNGRRRSVVDLHRFNHSSSGHGPGAGSGVLGAPLLVSSFGLALLGLAKHEQNANDPKTKESENHKHYYHLNHGIVTSADVALCESAHMNMNMNIRHSATVARIQRGLCLDPIAARYLVNWNRPLGEGGFGAVYKATDRRSGDTVALKQISKRFTNDQGFQREMSAILHIRNSGGHPNICSAHELFDEGNHYYLSLDLISGGEMFDHLIRSGPYSETEASRLMKEVASALAFMHGIGCVHGDLKPENLMLSTENTGDAVIKVIDFGCAQLIDEGDTNGASPSSNEVVGLTEAYSPPEMLKLSPSQRHTIAPSLDMWAIGIILHIMLVGCHPFDLVGDAPNEEIIELVVNETYPVTLEEGSPYTEHLSESAIDLIKQLLQWDPKKRITAAQMLQHPWVRGLTCKDEIIAGSDEKLSKFRVFKSGLEARVFADIMEWSDQFDQADEDDEETMHSVAQRTSLLERSFKKLDAQHKGFITARDLKKGVKLGTADQGASSSETGDQGDAESLSLSGFTNLLSENLKDKYFGKGEVVFREGEEGHTMLFINSGKVEVSTEDGFHTTLDAGQFVGEGALISKKKKRNGTVKCLTPVHAIEISRENFEKYLAEGENKLTLLVREKDKMRALERTTTILQNQCALRAKAFQHGDYIFRAGDPTTEMYILEEGKVQTRVGRKKDNKPPNSTSTDDGGAVSMESKPGDMFGVSDLVLGCVPRNASAVCVNDSGSDGKGCIVHAMTAPDFYKMLDSSSVLESSVQDYWLRKEFQKAVAFVTQKDFPTHITELKEVFDIIDKDKSGTITQDEIESFLVQLNPNVAANVVRGIMNTLDIDESGEVSFDEFARIFEMNVKKMSRRRNKKQHRYSKRK